MQSAEFAGSRVDPGHGGMVKWNQLVDRLSHMPKHPFQSVQRAWCLPHLVDDGQLFSLSLQLVIQAEICYPRRQEFRGLGQKAQLGRPIGIWPLAFQPNNSGNFT